MTPSLAKTLAAVPKLNHDGQPFTYAADGDTVVGSWTEGEATYTLVVTLDQENGSFSYTEKTRSKARPKPVLETERVKAPLFAFLVKHGWDHPDEVRPLESRWVVR